MSKARITKVFNRRKKTNKDGQADVEIYIYLDGKKKYYRTGISIDPGQWSKKKNDVNDKHPNYIHLNFRIQDIITQAEAYQLKVIQSRDITFDDFDFHFKVKKSNDQDDFIQFAEKYTTQDHSVTDSTTHNRNQFINHMKACFPNGLKFSLLNHENIEKFDNYLRSLGHSPGTVNKHHNRAKKFIQEAINREIIGRSPYATFKPKRPQQQIKEILWYHDIEEIEKLSYSGTMELARLKFLFSCYTGLRVSDSKQLNWNHIRNNKIILSTIKTNRQAYIPMDLFPGTLKIINRVKELYDSKTIFPPIADPLYNRNLKTIGIDASIPFPLTSHVARHTFCTLVAHQTQSPFKVMEYTGISKIDTAMIYINLQKLYT